MAYLYVKNKNPGEEKRYKEDFMMGPWEKLRREERQKHERELDALVKDCRAGDYTYLEFLGNDPALKSSLRRNNIADAEFENWKTESLTWKSRGGDFLSFNCGGQVFGIKARQIQEVGGMLPVKKISGAPTWVLGKANLRGMTAIVIDLRIKLALDVSALSERSALVVLYRKAGSASIAIQADSLITTLTLKHLSVSDPDQNERLPLLGTAQTSDGTIKLLDTEQILSAEEAEMLATT